MLCYILAQYALFVYKNILLFFDIKKQSHRNCCRILNINLVIGICKFISSKLWILPTPTRHLQIQFQLVADASNPDQASTNPNPASCRYFRPQDRHLQIQYQQIADTSNPDQASANPIPANCRYFQPQDRHLQIQYQQAVDASNPDQASTNPIPANCRYFHIRNSPLYVSANSNPANCRCFRTQDRHLQIQYQQIADASNPDQASAVPILANCRYFHIRNSPLYVSTNPIPTSCRCFRP